MVRSQAKRTPRMAKGSIIHGRLKPSGATIEFSTVSERTRSGIGRRQLEPDRAADVVHDQVEAVEPQRVDGRVREAPQPGPAVVERRAAVGEAQAGQVEGHAPQVARGQLGQHAAIQERRHRYAVDADHGLAGALLAHEAADGARVEGAAEAAVALDHLLRGHAHNPTAVRIVPMQCLGR